MITPEQINATFSAAPTSVDSKEVIEAFRALALRIIETTPICNEQEESINQLKAAMSNYSHARVKGCGA